MMTYFVIVIFGTVMATVGPVSPQVCQSMTQDFTARLDDNFAKNGPDLVNTVQGKVVQRNDVWPACFIQDERPALYEKVETN